MQPNTVKERVLRGELAIGAQINIPSPELVEFCGLLGFEFIFIDAEHGPIWWNDCQSLVRACDAKNIGSIVRVPKLDHSIIAKYLETGVQGVAIPHINTAEQAEAAVKASRYAPLGCRGCDEGASRSSEYGLFLTGEEYFHQANREIMVAVWVEETEGMRNLDEILQVEGVDAVNLGPGDLALSMGLPGRSDHPDVQAWVAEGRKKILESGKVLFAEPADAVAARKAILEGARLVSTSVARLWTNATRAYLQELRRVSGRCRQEP